MAQSQKTEDVSGGSASAGVPGAASSLPRPTSRPGQGGNSVERRTESITYQTSRVVRRVKIPLGTVKKISVAVLVDQDVRWEGKGPQARRVLTPPPPEKLKVIKDLVSGIAGIQTDRGDQVLVETLPFDTTLRQAPPETQTAPPAPPAPVSPYPGWWPAQLRSLPAVIGAAVALVLVLLGLPLMLILRRKGARRPAAAARPAALAAGSAPAGAISAAGAAAVGDDFASKARAQIAQNEARVEAQEMEMLASLKLPTTSKKSEVLKKQISESAKKDPVATAQLVRTWLNERER
jgi:flagellar M-ring protein FliF